MKKVKTKNFIDEIYSPPPRRKYPTNKKLSDHIEEIWSKDLADMIDYKFQIIKVIDTYSS